MKPHLILRSMVLVTAAAFMLAASGCETSNGSSVAGSTGPGGQSANAPSSGVGPGGHAPATNQSRVGPTNAGPAGSQ